MPASHRFQIRLMRKISSQARQRTSPNYHHGPGANAMNVRLRRHSALAILPGIFIVSLGTKTGAQEPAPPGVVTQRHGVDANGNAGRRYPITVMAAATKARV